MDGGLTPPLWGRRRFAAHLGIASPDRPLLEGGIDPIAQIERAHALGFAGITDNGLMLRPPEVQRRMGERLRALGMEMGSFTHDPPGERPRFFWGASQPDLDAALAPTFAAAERVGGVVNLVLLDTGAPRADQLARATDNLGRAAMLARERGIRLALEPVSRIRVPLALVEHMAEAAAIVVRIDDAAFGLILDSCHMALGGEDIAAAILAQADRLRVVQIADMPGRVEPGAGELDFASILAALDRIGWQGMLEVEFDPLGDEPAMLGALARLG
ncbi:TIM barrel protein [Sphingomonas sp. C8-2]|jgi:hydroxypyruvate isomerase|nr:TIM barrel protein [Sphingomonas sp. C8-2]